MSQILTPETPQPQQQPAVLAAAMPRTSIPAGAIWLLVAMLGLGLLVTAFGWWWRTAYPADTSVMAQIFSTRMLAFVLVGFAAGVVDGALGMAYGISSNTLLMSVGVPPAAASAGVHMAEVFTAAASGVAHLRLGNVNKKLFMSLVIPGAIGAILGATVLSNIDGKVIKPYVYAYLLVMGLLIIRRSFQRPKRKPTRSLFPLAVFGGFMDSVGGGGWGPIVVSTLINRGRAPQYTIGSVNLAEFFIALAGSITFIISLKSFDHWLVVLGLIIGGVVAAPVGAMLCRYIRTRYLMLAVGLLISFLSIRTLYIAFFA